MLRVLGSEVKVVFQHLEIMSQCIHLCSPIPRGVEDDQPAMAPTPGEDVLAFTGNAMADNLHTLGLSISGCTSPKNG